jgi:MFS family permease
MLVIFSQLSWLPLTLLVLVFLGMPQIAIMNVANALVQTHVPDALRGRVMSIYNLTFLGMMPIGGVWAGLLANRIGERETVLIGAIIVAAVAVAVWVFFPRIREME